MSTPVCNLNCICIDSDCKFKHYLPIKDRRSVKKAYDLLDSPSKVESAPEFRRANCRFGQVCNNESCGYKHRLSFKDRIKLITTANAAKVESVTQVPKSVPVYVKFDVKCANPFNSLSELDV